MICRVAKGVAARPRCRRRRLLRRPTRPSHVSRHRTPSAVSLSPPTPPLPRTQEATIASQLLVAVRTRDVATLRRLCSGTSEQLAAALKRRDGQGHTLMHWAAKSGEVEMLELLAGESGLALRCSGGRRHLTAVVRLWGGISRRGCRVLGVGGEIAPLRIAEDPVAPPRPTDVRRALRRTKHARSVPWQHVRLYFFRQHGTLPHGSLLRTRDFSLS